MKSIRGMTSRRGVVSLVSGLPQEHKIYPSIHCISIVIHQIRNAICFICNQVYVLNQMGSEQQKIFHFLDTWTFCSFQLENKIEHFGIPDMIKRWNLSCYAGSVIAGPYRYPYHSLHKLMKIYTKCREIF